VRQERERIRQRRRTLLRKTRTTAPLPLRCIAECCGTAFVFGCGALGTGLPRSLCLGLAVSTAVATCAPISGAHFNPAVTLAMAAGGSLPEGEAYAYAVSQYSGALLTSMAMGVVPAIAPPGAFVGLASEISLTALLVYACMSIGDGVEAGSVHKRSAPLIVGLLIVSLNLCFGHIGAGINPAMSGAPGIVAMLSGHGAASLAGGASYTLGPLLGGVLGGCVFAIGSGRGRGLYGPLARLGREASPWYRYGPWCRQPLGLVPDLASNVEPHRGVVVPTRRPSEWHVQGVTGPRGTSTTSPDSH